VFGASKLSAGGSGACAITTTGDLRCWGVGNAAPKTVSPGVQYAQVSVGSSGQTCAIRADHTLYCWQTSQYDPQSRDTGSFVQVSVGGGHACAIASSGTLYCWGSNYNGQLGIGSNQTQTNLTPVGSATDWATVSAGGSTTCALKKDASLWCWGYNGNGQVGDNGGSSVDSGIPQQQSPVPIAQGTTWRSISAGTSATCGVTAAGALECWGALATRFDKIPTSVDTAPDWERVAVGATHACAIKQSGRLYCWGSNTSGESGSTSSTALPSPSPVGTDSDWVDVAAGQGFSCGTKSSGAVLCWGNNGAGQLGSGTAFHLEPTKIGAGADWKHVAAAGGTTCAVKKDGTLSCWGQVPGLTTDPRRQTPYAIGTATDWARVALGNSSVACAMKNDQSLYCWGSGYSGQLGLGPTSSAVLPTSTGIKAISIGIGDDHTCAVATNASLYCWGQSIFGKTVHGDSNVPLVAGTDAWAAVTATGESTCGIRSTGELYCFGFGFSSMEKIGTATNWTDLSVSPSGTTTYYYGIGGGSLQKWNYIYNPTAVGVETTWRMIAATGSGHQCAIRSDNTLACMGSNNSGQLGDGTTTQKSVLTTIGTFADWQIVATGNAHTCGIRNGGELYCWGDNSNGQMGDGSSWSSTPVAVQ
jgi:alpha-tubulin suppressor-like RCC1 family protein